MIRPRLRTPILYLSLVAVSTTAAEPAGAQDKPKRAVNTLSGVVVRQADGRPVAGVSVAMARWKDARLFIGEEPTASGPTRRVLFFFPRANGRSACEARTDEQGRFTLRSFVSLNDRYTLAAGSSETGFALLGEVVPAEHQDQPLRIEIPEPAYLALPAQSDPALAGVFFEISSYHPPPDAETDAQSPAADLPGRPWPPRVRAWTSGWTAAGMATRCGPLIPDYVYRVSRMTWCAQLQYSATLYSQLVAVPAGRALPVLLPTEGVELSGRVIATNGQPLGLVNVMVEQAGPQRLTLGALTDDKGRFTIKNLAPGKHKLRLLRYAVRVGPG